MTRIAGRTRLQSQRPQAAVDHFKRSAEKMSEEAPRPLSYEGDGKYIRRFGDDQYYGHVVLRISFPEGLRDHRVEINLPNEEIQKKDWPAVEEATLSWLSAHSTVLGTKKLRIEIVDGSWAGYAKYSGHAQATAFALDDAAKQAGIVK